MIGLVLSATRRQRLLKPFQALLAWLQKIGAVADSSGRHAQEAVLAAEDVEVDLAVAEDMVVVTTKEEVAVAAEEAMLPKPNCCLKAGFPKKS